LKTEVIRPEFEEAPLIVQSSSSSSSQFVSSSMEDSAADNITKKSKSKKRAAAGASARRGKKSAVAIYSDSNDEAITNASANGNTNAESSTVVVEEEKFVAPSSSAQVLTPIKSKPIPVSSRGQKRGVQPKSDATSTQYNSSAAATAIADAAINTGADLSPPKTNKKLKTETSRSGAGGVNGTPIKRDPTAAAAVASTSNVELLLSPPSKLATRPATPSSDRENKDPAAFASAPLSAKLESRRPAPRGVLKPATAAIDTKPAAALALRFGASPTKAFQYEAAADSSRDFE
jgi:hypothetical protein